MVIQLIRHISKQLVRRMFQVTATVEQFKQDNPTIPVLAAGATKVVQLAPTDDDTLRRGEHWVHAIRGTLIATPDALVCKVLPLFEPLHAPANGMLHYADFTLPAPMIAQATLVHAQQGIQSGLVLKILMEDGRRFQFGLMPNRAWERSLPFPLRIEAASMGWSRYSIMARARVMGFFIIIVIFSALIAYWS